MEVIAPARLTRAGRTGPSEPPYDASMALPLRQAVRGVVVDKDERLLLVRFGLPDGPLWAAPGGGIEPGESQDVAIRRELREEVGLHDAVIGPAIWRRTHRFPLSPEFGGQQETFFLVRVNAFTCSPEFTEEELRAEGLTGWRWWTAGELTESTDRFAPMSLASLYQSLLASGPPDAPIDTGE
jgi:8-oxo-dGTP diphosphatase